MILPNPQPDTLRARIQQCLRDGNVEQFRILMNDPSARAQIQQLRVKNGDIVLPFSLRAAIGMNHSADTIEQMVNVLNGEMIDIGDLQWAMEIGDEQVISALLPIVDKTESETCFKLAMLDFRKDAIVELISYQTLDTIIDAMVKLWFDGYRKAQYHATYVSNNPNDLGGFDETAKMALFERLHFLINNSGGRDKELIKDLTDNWSPWRDTPKLPQEFLAYHAAENSRAQLAHHVSDDHHDTRQGRKM